MRYMDPKPLCLHGEGQRPSKKKEDPVKDPNTPMWQRWARFRFAVIGELLSCPPSKGQLQGAIARLARQTWQHPIDPERRIRIGASTIERWYYKAKSAADPIAALGRKIRRDARAGPCPISCLPN